MSEKGVLVSDADTGESVAARDAYETDDDSNNRIVQLIDRSQRQHGITISTSTGLVREVTGSTDDFLMAPVPSDITSNALTVGDKTTLVVACKYQLASATENFVVTPIVLDSNNAMVGFLTPRVVKGFAPTSGEAFYFSFTGESTYNGTFSEILSWNVLGAHKIGIHVRFCNGTGTLSGDDGIKVFANVITGPIVGEAAATPPSGGAYAHASTGGGG